MTEENTRRNRRSEGRKGSAVIRAGERYALRLYIVATTPRSRSAVANIRKLCDEHLPGRYDLEVIDISRRPELAAAEQIIAAPTLIKTLPAPLRRFIGDLSETRRILIGLDLTPADGATDVRKGF